jgi:hypothetical protein
MVSEYNLAGIGCLIRNDTTVFQRLSVHFSNHCRCELNLPINAAMQLWIDGTSSMNYKSPSVTTAVALVSTSGAFVALSDSKATASRIRCFGINLRRWRWFFGLLLGILLWNVAEPKFTLAQDDSNSGAASDPKIPRAREMHEIENEILRLQERFDELEKQNIQIERTNAEIKSSDQQLQATTTQQLHSLQSQITTSSSPGSVAEALNSYLGNYRFTIVGSAAGSFIYDRASNINTFSLVLEPIILWRLNDRMLFEGTIEADLPEGSSAEFQVPVATLHYFLNDYSELNLGIFDQPFGDWYEDQSATWINRFITAPLPYGVNPLIPPTDLGVQLRGAFQWRDVGQVADYTLWTSNGPGFTQSTCTSNTPPSPLPTCPSTPPLVGDTLVSVNNIRVNTHSPAFGARFRVYPLPVDSDLGRLELGASTYDGKWLNDLWLTSWGIDFNYFRDNLQARGEWLQMYRQMPSGTGADNRQGWYVQVGYSLTGLQVPFVPPSINEVLSNLEPLVRYSGINQRATVQSEIATAPEIGFSGSPAVYLPHAREVALGLDYWFAPSIVWQNELDFELPRAGGLFSDTGLPVGATSNDRAFLSQFAIGF